MNKSLSILWSRRKFFRSCPGPPSDSWITITALIFFNVLSFIPCNCLGQSFFKLRPCDKPELFFSTFRVCHSPRLSVGPCFIPNQFSFVSGNIGYQICQIFNGYFKSRTQIYRIRLVVPFHSQYYSFCCIFNIQKLSCSFSCPPNSYRRTSFLFCFIQLSDKRWDY